MANSRMAVRRLLDKHQVEAPDDFVHEMLEAVINSLTQAELSDLIGADR